jgi:cytochrome c oxidase subunit 2
MNYRRVGLLAILAVVLAGLAVQPVAAQSTDDSTTEEEIWDLNSQLLYVAVPITVLVEGILVYTVWKFRKSESPLPTRENRRLEITWTIATAIILLFVGVASYQVVANPYVTAETAGGVQEVEDGGEPVEVQVIAQKYSWTFEYPNQNVTTTGTMVIPENRNVQLNITSTDWLHAFHVPGLGLKQDAFPGQSNYIITKAQNTGTYQLYCAEYCGVGHSDMLGKVDVRTQDDYQSWLDSQRQPASSGNTNSTSGNSTTGNSLAGAVAAP